MIRNAKKLLMVTVFVLILFSRGLSYGGGEMEIMDFCGKYGFALRVNIDKEEIILKRRALEVRFLLDSSVAVAGRDELWYLDSPVRVKNRVVYLPASFVRRLLNASPQTHKTREDEPGPEPVYHGSHNKITFVVLDAGHGGRDPGNTHFGIREKKVNLSVTRKVRAMLKRRIPGVRVYLTRDGDQYLSLEKRSSKAVRLSSVRRQGIFVSIHANSTLNRRTRGVETFFYSATAKSTRRNRLKCIQGLSRSITAHPVAQRIISKMYDLQISKESQVLASLVNQGVYSRVKGHTRNRGIKAHRPYFVITHNNLPSILVEVGFLSNRTEGRKLASSSYQGRVSAGIADGIVRFIGKYNRSNGFLD